MKQLPTIKNFLPPRSHYASISRPSLVSGYRLFIFIGFIAVLIGSCEKPHDHIKRTVSLNAIFQDSATLFIPGSPGVPEQVRINGWGSGTPIGKSTFEDNVKVDTDVSPEVNNGTDVITTQDGDKIFSVFTGYSPDPDKEGNYQVFNKGTITGGTGKFAGATGSLMVTVKGNSNHPVETATFVGTITY